jgi:hypothetical protein
LYRENDRTGTAAAIIRLLSLFEWYVISEDGFGNPIGMAQDGRVMISDHDGGQASLLATEFEYFLLHHCLGTT